MLSKAAQHCVLTNMTARVMELSGYVRDPDSYTNVSSGFSFQK